MRLACATTVALVAASGVAACGVDGPADTATASPSVLDVSRGTYHGIQVGDSRRDVVRRLGRSRCSPETESLPLKAGHGAGSGGSYLGSPAGGAPTSACFLRYREVSVGVDPRDGAWVIITIDPRAETDRGVGVGDSPDAIEQRYPRAECTPVEDGDEAPRPVCTVAPRRSYRDSAAVPPVLLTFTLDSMGRSVRSIWLSVTTPRAIRKLRRAR